MSLRPKARMAVTVTAAAVMAATLAMQTPRQAQADEGAAFVGGLIGGHVLTRMSDRSERRTRAAEAQAQQRQQAPAQQREPTVEERLETLDQLAAKGIISKEEYDRRRQEILDGI